MIGFKILLAQIAKYSYTSEEIGENIFRFKYIERDLIQVHYKRYWQDRPKIVRAKDGEIPSSFHMICPWHQTQILMKDPEGAPKLDQLIDWNCNKIKNDLLKIIPEDSKNDFEEFFTDLPECNESR